MRIALVMVMAWLFAGCTSKPPGSLVTYAKPGTGESMSIKRESLLGTWYGEQPTTDGTMKSWITIRRSDGEFRVHFRELKDGVVLRDSIEVGEWGLTYDLEVVITRGWLDERGFRPASANAYFWDVYRIEHVDGERLIYIHHGTGHRYEVRRVADGFQFPDEPNQALQTTSVTRSGFGKVPVFERQRRGV